MRVLFTLILTLTYVLALSQDQATYQSQKKINESIDKILLLNRLDDIIASICTNSLSWVYMITDQRSKKNLSDQISVELPKIKEQLRAANLGVEFTSRLTNLMSSVDSLASVAEVTMKALVIFEDYEDSTGSYSENYKICKRRIDQVILPQYRSIAAIIGKEISSEEKQLAVILSDASKTHAKSQIDWSLIEYRYKTLSDKFRVKKLNNQLLSGSINWVYRGYDSVSKELLVKNINVDAKELEVLLVKNTENWDIREQLMTESLVSTLDTNIVHLRVSIMSNLNTEADYEDGMTMLLAEDEIQSSIMPRFLLIQSLVDQILESEIEKTRNSISELSGKKNNDIRKMLRYNYATLQFALKEANKSNPHFNLDALIETIIPIYSRRFTHDEIKEILKFQDSKVGKKMRKNSEEIMLETMEATVNYYKSLPKKEN